ncbi:unnamed protein product [Alopecurus aequalis]
MEAVGSPLKKRKSAPIQPLETGNPAAAAAKGGGPGSAAEDQEPRPKEMKAVGSPSKKRKSARIEPLEEGNPATAAAEGGGPGSAAEVQEHPPPGADGGAAQDRISDLPVAVLQEIISLLSTKEGARTRALASAWRDLWWSAPLNIDQDFWRSATLNLDHLWRCIDGKNLADVVSHILSAHKGPSRRFCAPVYHLHGNRPATADAWLESPALRNLQELELCSFQRGLPYPFTRPPPSPVAAFRFYETLRVATIGNCQFPDITAQAIHFPKLRKLCLELVTISESSLHTMIAGCIALECLLIAYSDGFRCVQINSISLRSICLQSSHRKLIIQNAPCLERLLQLKISDSHTSVNSVPKLDILGCLSSYHNTRFVLDSTVIQGLRVDTTVQILSVDMGLLSLEDIIKLMRCFPCLERLYIKCAGPREKNTWRSQREALLKSLDIRLKKISWGYYEGVEKHANFATFFVENAKVLELMTFQVYHEDYNDEEFFARQRKMLRLDRKASRGAQFHFTLDDPHRYVKDFGLHDLDLADPFERKDPYQFRALS